MKQFILLCGLFIFTGCSHAFFLNTEETIILDLPVWPPEDDYNNQFPELSRWFVKTSCADSKSSFYLSPSTATISFSIKKNEPFCATFLPITKLPLSSNCELSYFYPAGIIYPYCKNISWSQGYLASCMEKIFSSKMETGVSDSHINSFISQFNWKKAQDLIDNKIDASYEQDEIFYNPWLLDTSRLLENLCYNNFKASLLNITGCYTYPRNTLFPESNIEPLLPFIPENSYFKAKQKITIIKDKPTLISDGKIYGTIIRAQSAKKVSKEIVYLPIYITEL